MDPEKNVYVNSTSSPDEEYGTVGDVSEPRKGSIAVQEAADLYGDIQTAEREYIQYHMPVKSNPADQTKNRIWLRFSWPEVPTHSIHRPGRNHRYRSLPGYWQGFHRWWSLVCAAGLYDDRCGHLCHDAVFGRDGDLVASSWCYSAVLRALCRSSDGFCGWLGEWISLVLRGRSWLTTHSIEQLVLQCSYSLRRNLRRFCCHWVLERLDQSRNVLTAAGKTRTMANNLSQLPGSPSYSS